MWIHMWGQWVTLKSMGFIPSPPFCKGCQCLAPGFSHVHIEAVSLWQDVIFIFQNLGLTSLYKLQLQHNHIGTIDLHAFLGVTQLRILDLSYNHLYYLLPATFEDTPHLRSLYLQGNRLKINPGPILIIPALQVCLSSYVYKKNFTVSALW
jgi:hypothetical protein